MDGWFTSLVGSIVLSYDSPKVKHSSVVYTWGMQAQSIQHWPVYLLYIWLECNIWKKADIYDIENPEGWYAKKSLCSVTLKTTCVRLLKKTKIACTFYLNVAYLNVNPQDTILNISTQNLLWYWKYSFVK